MPAKDTCPSCGASVEPDALLCPNCELILDAERIPDAPTNGDLSVVRRMLEVPQAGVPTERPAPRPAVHGKQEGPTRIFALGRTAGVPIVVASLTKKMFALNDLEAFVTSFIDGESDVETLALRANLTTMELGVVLQALQDKMIIDFADEPAAEPVRAPIALSNVVEEKRGSPTVRIDPIALSNATDNSTGVTDRGLEPVQQDRRSAPTVRIDPEALSAGVTAQGLEPVSAGVTDQSLEPVSAEPRRSAPTVRFDPNELTEPVARGRGPATEPLATAAPLPIRLENVVSVAPAEPAADQPRRRRKSTRASSSAAPEPRSTPPEPGASPSRTLIETDEPVSRPSDETIVGAEGEALLAQLRNQPGFNESASKPRRLTKPDRTEQDDTDPRAATTRPPDDTGARTQDETDPRARAPRSTPPDQSESSVPAVEGAPNETPPVPATNPRARIELGEQTEISVPAVEADGSNVSASPRSTPPVPETNPRARIEPAAQRARLRRDDASDSSASTQARSTPPVPETNPRARVEPLASETSASAAPRSTPPVPDANASRASEPERARDGTDPRQYEQNALARTTDESGEQQPVPPPDFSKTDPRVFADVAALAGPADQTLLGAPHTGLEDTDPRRTRQADSTPLAQEPRSSPKLKSGPLAPEPRSSPKLNKGTPARGLEATALSAAHQGEPETTPIVPVAAEPAQTRRPMPTEKVLPVPVPTPPPPQPLPPPVDGLEHIPTPVPRPAPPLPTPPDATPSTPQPPPSNPPARARRTLPSGRTTGSRPAPPMPSAPQPPPVIEPSIVVSDAVYDSPQAQLPEGKRPTAPDLSPLPERPSGVTDRSLGPVLEEGPTGTVRRPAPAATLIDEDAPPPPKPVRRRSLADVTVAPADTAENAIQVALRMEQRGRFDEAVRYLETCIAQSPDAPSLYNRLAIILMRERADLVRAERLLHKAVELAPTHEVYQRNLKTVVAKRATKR